MVLRARSHLTLVPPSDGRVAQMGNGVVVVTLAGEYDVFTERELAALLFPAEASAVAIIDCTKVTFFDSCALECLLRLRNRVALRRGKADVRVAGASQTLARLFSVTGLDRVFKLYASVEHAAEATA